MCTVLLPPGVNPIAVKNKEIYNKIFACPVNRDLQYFLEARNT
jgi:hypothetical protein